MGGEEAATNASASGPTGPPSDPTSDAAMDAKEAFGDMRESSEDGKVEMSLINFSLSNPGWTPCEKSVHFMRSIMESGKLPPPPPPLCDLYCTSTRLCNIILCAS